jgi:hypothetical protein
MAMGQPRIAAATGSTNKSAYTHTKHSELKRCND